MLDSNDKKWIRETIDERLDDRFTDAEKRLNKVMDERFTDAEKRLNKVMDERFTDAENRLNKVMDERFTDAENRLNKVMDERFADAIETFDRRINERFDAFETRFMLLMENEVAPLLKIHSEVIPDTYKSYRNLEERVETLEQNYDVLKNVISSRL